METYSNDSKLDGPVVLKFGAVWCAVCKSSDKNVEKLETEFDGVKVVHIDVDDYPEMAQKYAIKMLPTLVFLKDDKEVNRINGKVLIEAMRKSFRDLKFS